jgi:hypothetical protein
MNAQNSKVFSLQILSLDPIENTILLKKNYLKKFNSKNAISAETHRVLFVLKKDGFYTVTTDSITIQEQAYKIYVNLGTKTSNARIRITNNSDLEFLNSQYTIHENYIEIKTEEIPNLLQTLSDRMSNEGKSFSKTKLQHINIKNNTLYADLFIEQSKKRRIDSVIIKGYENFPKSYLKHFYKLHKNTVFNQKKLSEISKQTALLKFASELKPSEVLFSKDSTLLYIYLNKTKNNSFDGLVNFSSKENKKGISFSGYLDLSLNNMFNYGEEVAIHWKNTGEEKQFFKINIKAPYVLNTKVSTEASFSMYRHDSTFLSTTSAIRLLLPLNNKLTLGLSYDSEKSENLLEQLDNSIESFSNNFIGGQLNYQSLHKNLFNIEINASFGKRNAHAENNTQYKTNLTSSILLQLNHRLFLFLKNSSGHLSSKNYLQNELYRIGGTRSIRGFDEQSIFTSTYSFINSEFRLSTQEKSHLYTVFDFGFFKNQRKRKNIFSVGLGYVFKTKRNLLDMSYVIGKHPENPLNTNNSKISIKILTFF